MLIVSLIVKSIPFEIRSSSALINQGLSLQNKIQVFITILLLMLSFIIILSKRVLIKSFFIQTNLYITILIWLYILSTLWSVWPELTIYKSFELISYYIISIYLFRFDTNLIKLEKLLVIMIIIILAGGLIYVYKFDKIIGGIRSNTGTLIAAIYILYLIFIKNVKHKKIKLVFALFVMLIFGSLATFIALLVSFLILYYNSVHNYLKPLLVMLIIFLIILSINLEFQSDNSILLEIAKISGKRIDMLTTMTGRLPLWSEIIKVSFSNPFGLGYVAGERMFAFSISSLQKLGWAPTHAHNGYLASLTSIGFLGPIIVIKILLSLWKKFKENNSNHFKFITGSIVLIAINNLTIMGLGGQFNPVWLIIFVLAGLRIRR